MTPAHLIHTITRCDCVLPGTVDQSGCIGPILPIESRLRSTPSGAQGDGPSVVVR